MNYELIMLREAKRVYKLSKGLSKDVEYKALTSYMCETVKGGTIGQIAEIGEIVRLRDECIMFCQVLRDALRYVDKQQRWLLREYYFRQARVGEIAQRLNVSVQKVYELLHKSRVALRSELKKLGCSEQWFREAFSNIDFLSARLAA